MYSHIWKRLNNYSGISLIETIDPNMGQGNTFYNGRNILLYRLVCFKYTNNLNKVVKFDTTEIQKIGFGS